MQKGLEGGGRCILEKTGTAVFHSNQDLLKSALTCAFPVVGIRCVPMVAKLGKNLIACVMGPIKNNVTDLWGQSF